MSDRSNDGFASRWSRRKAQARQGEAVPAEVPLPQAVAAKAMPAAMPVAAELPVVKPGSEQEAEPGSPAAAAGPAAPPPPTLEDVAQLTSSSNFSRFVGSDVDPAVKNAAMKKLFADPRFNVMDGLDTYIDDYNKADPLPRSMMRQMVQARVLGLLDDDLEEQPAPAMTPMSAPTEAEQQPSVVPGGDVSGADVPVGDVPGPIARDAGSQIDPDPSSRPD